MTPRMGVWAAVLCENNHEGYSLLSLLAMVAQGFVLAVFSGSLDEIFRTFV